MTKYKIYVQYGVVENAPWGQDIVWIDAKTITGTINHIIKSLKELKASTKTACHLPSHQIHWETYPVQYA